jgi:hypothetical protein
MLFGNKKFSHTLMNKKEAETQRNETDETIFTTTKKRTTD